MQKELTNRIQKNPSDFQAYTKLGHFYLKKEKNYDLAIHHFREALEIKPDLIAAIRGVIDAEKELGNHEEAFILSEDAIKRFPENASLHFRHINLYLIIYESEDEKVLQTLLNLQKRFSTFPEPHIRLGNFYLKKEKNYDLAKHHFKMAIEIKPDLIAAIRGVINAEKELGNLEEAFVLSEDAIKRFPENASLHFRHINLYHIIYESEDEKILQTLLNLQKRFSTFTEPHIRLGNFYLKKEKNYDLAKHHFKMAIEIKPDLMPAIQGLINVERELGNLEEAFVLSEDAIKRFPENIGINNAYINVLIWQNRKDDAITYLEKFSEPPLSLRLADLYIGNRAYTEALHILSAIDEKNKYYDKKLLKESTVYHRLDDAQMALDTITKAYGLFPDNLQVNLMLSEYLFHWVSKKEGYRQLKETQERFEADPKIILSKCSMLNRDGKRLTVSSILKDAIKQFNYHPGIAQRLFATLVEEGDFEEAKDLLSTLQDKKVVKADVLLQLQGSLALKRWRLEEAYNLYHKAREESLPSQKHYHPISTITLLTFRIDEAFKVQKSMSDDHSIALKNPTQSFHGQLLNEFQIEKDLCRHLHHSLASSNTESLRDAVLDYPHNIASSIAWLIHLRQSGYFTQISKNATSSIPKHLIHFWDQSVPPDDIVEYMQSWKEHNPSWKQFIFDDTLAKAFIEEHFGDSLLKVYRHANSPANKSDILRLAALYVLGGVYADADDRCNGSLEPLIKHYNFVGYQEYLGTSGNNFLAVSPEHPVIRSALDAIIEDFESGTPESIWLSSGPGLMTRMVAGYIAENFEVFKEGNLDMILYDVHELSKTMHIHCFAHYKTTALHWGKSEYAI